MLTPDNLANNWRQLTGACRTALCGWVLVPLDTFT
jgi:hypothetical protein